MRPILFTLTLLFTLAAAAQRPRVGIECYMATYYAQQYDSPADLLDVGQINNLAGVRTYFNLTKTLSFVAGACINQSKKKAQTEHVLRLAMAYNFSPFKQISHLNLTTEGGLELALYQGIKIPFFLGVDYSLTPVIKWTFRARIPTFIDVGPLDTYNFAETGLETGLKVLLEKGPGPTYERSGNPFILR